LVASEFVLTGRLASIGGHPGDWREQRLALIERVDGVGNTDIWAGFQGHVEKLEIADQ
jgi:hypothetical protein